MRAFGIVNLMVAAGLALASATFEYTIPLTDGFQLELYPYAPGRVIVVLTQSVGSEGVHEVLVENVTDYGVKSGLAFGVGEGTYFVVYESGRIDRFDNGKEWDALLRKQELSKSLLNKPGRIESPTFWWLAVPSLALVVTGVLSLAYVRARHMPTIPPARE